MKIKKFKDNKRWKEEMDILVTERLGQIYTKIVRKENVKIIKEEEEIMEEKLENILKEETQYGFEIYCDYEEKRSEYIHKLLTTYYKQGFKDAIKLIFKNLY